MGVFILHTIFTTLDLVSSLQSHPLSQTQPLPAPPREIVRVRVIAWSRVWLGVTSRLLDRAPWSFLCSLSLTGCRRSWDQIIALLQDNKHSYHRRSSSAPRSRGWARVSKIRHVRVTRVYQWWHEVRSW